MTISGVYTALVTPFTKDDIDFEGMRKNIRFQIDQGVSGIDIVLLSRVDVQNRY